jgi:MDMPI C-terminal domain
VTLRRTDTGETTVVSSGEPTVEISGPPSELMVYAYNRKDHARVEVAGDPALAAKLGTTRLGL